MEKGCRTCCFYGRDPLACNMCLINNYDKWTPKDEAEEIDVVNDIGVPATLELCAEEAVELAHAALKMARKLRGENPTPKSMDDILEDLTEELGDVQINIDKILEYGIVPKKDVDAVKEFKRKRWEERLREKKQQMEG